MKTEYLPAFIKDVRALRGSTLYEKVRKLAFFDIPQLHSIGDVPHLVKLSDAKDAYRIRIGDYRIGVFYRGGVIIFARCLHRKEMYRYFP